MSDSRPSAGAVFALVVLAVFTVFITWRAKLLEVRIAEQNRAFALTGKLAPDFELHATDGRTISLKDFRDRKNVVMSFWASSCPPCRLEMPALGEFYKKNHKIESDFEFLAINVGDLRTNAETVASQAQIPFPVLLDLDQKVSEAYGVTGLPTLLVIDKNGKITEGVVGLSSQLESTLTAKLGLGKNNADADRR